MIKPDISFIKPIDLRRSVLTTDNFSFYLKVGKRLAWVHQTQVTVGKEEVSSALS
jgi:hypothetical protein